MAQIKQRGNHQRNRHGDRTFGQNTKRHQNINAVQQSLLWLATVDVHQQQGGRQQSIEQRIGSGDMADHIDAQRGRGNKSSNNGGGVVQVAAAESKNAQRPGHTGQSRWQAEGPHFGTEHTDRGGLQPVNQNRFIEADAVIKPGGDEVIAFKHAAGRFAESPFVMVEQQETTQIQKKEGSDDCQQPHRNLYPGEALIQQMSKINRHR